MLEWHLAFGQNPTRIRIWEKQRDDGEPTPLDKYVSPYADLVWAWTAFNRLDNRRTWSEHGTPHAITTQEVLAYADLHGLDERDRDDLDHWVAFLDGVYFSWFARDREASDKRSKGGK